MSNEKVKGVRDRKEMVKRLKEKEVHIHWKIPFNEKEAIERMKKIHQEMPKMDKSFQEYWNGIKAMIKCEINYRARTKAEKLDFPELISHYENKEKIFHKQSIGHMKKSLGFFKEANEKIDPKTIQKFDNIAKSSAIVKKFQTELLDYSKYSLIDTDVDAATAEEVLQIYEKIIDEVISKKGFTGLVKHFADNVNKLIEIRSDERQNRGRIHRSPLYWWKYLAIAGVWAMFGAMCLAYGFTGESNFTPAIKAYYDSIDEYVNSIISTGC